MKIITLVENTSVSSKYKSKHGLCFYIETCKHKILFDLGSNNLFLKNAEKMNIDISAIDIVVISHGHIDHGGALKLFLEHNKIAKIHLRENAFENHYIKIMGIPIPIGLDSSLIANHQIVLTKGVFNIDENLILFSDVKNNNFFPKSNQSLFTKNNNKLSLDDFSHEQSLIIIENGKSILISGCAHSGILNIQEKAEKIIGCSLDVVISGMHLFNPMNGKYENDEFIEEVGRELLKTGSKYYTCHCTGKKAFNLLTEKLGNNIEYTATGRTIDF